MTSDRSRDPSDDRAESGGSRLLVAFSPGEDRRRIVEYLDSADEVVTADSVDALDSSFDCCLVDATTFARHHDELATLREESATAPPVLLVASAEAVDASASSVWKRADDVAKTPVRKAELRARVDRLVERHRLVRRVARSESRFRTLFETAPDPAFVFDGDGDLTAVNEAFCDAVGVDRARCVGDSLASLNAFPGESGARIASGDVESCERVRYVGADGASRLANVRVAALPRERERTRYVAMFRDVTDRVHRTRELQRQNERLNEFASILSHELRNPLNVAEGRLELARSKRSEDDENLQRVNRAHERMEEMISELLALSRQGAVIGETATADFEAVVTDAWDRTPTADAALVVDANGESITADLERVKDVFGNLFRNAVEHGRSDATVRVGLLPDEEGFYVADDGPGIPEDERETVFEAGYTTGANGTGFGLAIVDQIASAHGWTVDVEASERGGARFQVAGLADDGHDARGA